MKKIRTKETEIVTIEENKTLKFTLLDDDGQYKIMGETDEECVIEDCQGLGMREADRLIDILSSNAVTPGSIHDVILDMKMSVIK